MAERTRLWKTDTNEAVSTGEMWTDDNYVYFSIQAHQKKGHMDIITEQNTQVLPEILAKQTFWDRTRKELVPQVRSWAEEAKLQGREIKVVGEPSIELSTSLKTGKGLAKLFSATSYNFHFWTLVGFTAVFRVRMM